MPVVNGFPVANFQAKLDQLSSIGACEHGRNVIQKFLLHDNVYAALLVDHSHQTLCGIYVIQKYSETDAYLLFSGQVQSSLDKPLDQYDWMIIRGPKFVKKTDVNANLSNKDDVEVQVTKLRTPILPLGNQHDTPATHLQILFDLLTTNAFKSVKDNIGANITIDVDRTSPMYQSIIDNIGFSVMDSDEFQHIKVDSKAALKALSTTTEVNLSPDDLTPKVYEITPYRPEFFSGLVSYDGRQAGFRRATFLGLFVSSTFGFPLVDDNSKCLVAISGHQHLGFVVFTGDRLNCLYAENSAVAHKLAAAAIREMKSAAVHYYSVVRMADQLFPKAIQQPEKFIRRFHTRHIPAHVKWSKIFAVNCGFHLV